MTRFLTSIVLVVLFVTASPRAQGSAHPPTIGVDGTGPLTLLAQARRVQFLGNLEFYTLALYGEGPTLDPARLASADTAKALRIQVTQDENLRTRFALDWKHELVPRLEPAATAHLRGSFAPLRQGDVVLIDYVPSKGTGVRVNRVVAVSAGHHELMLAFLDHWLGQRPVSEDIKRTLLGSS